MDGDPWLLMVDAERNILIITSDLALLHTSDHWIADGNFDYQSWPFVQLHTIHGFCNTECKAAVHILMPRSHSHCLPRLLHWSVDYLKEIVQLWLDTIHADALENAPPGVLFEEHEANTAANLLLRLLRHLDHVQHFIG